MKKTDRIDNRCLAKSTATKKKKKKKKLSSEFGLVREGYRSHEGMQGFLPIVHPTTEEE
jgi:hypothetical protein